MRTSQLLVEFWKHCLNLVQYGIIDTECVAFCMKVIKGEDQWSSAGRVEWGIGLSGPLVLDAPEAAPTKIEDDTDTIDCLQAPELNSGFCTCGKPFDKPEMVLCNGNVSTSYHSNHSTLAPPSLSRFRGSSLLPNS